MDYRARRLKFIFHSETLTNRWTIDHSKSRNYEEGKAKVSVTAGLTSQFDQSCENVTGEFSRRKLRKTDSAERIKWLDVIKSIPDKSSMRSFVWLCSLHMLAFVQLSGPNFHERHLHPAYNLAINMAINMPIYQIWLSMHFSIISQQA